MEKKKINKLIIPFTRRTLSILSAATILATSMGCNNKDKNKDNNSDISIPTSSSSSMEEISSELDIIESIDSSTKETSSVESTNSTTSSSKESQTSAKPSSGSTTSNTQSSNKKPSSSQSSTSSTSSSTNSSQTPTPAPSMPTNLTVDNINDVEVFEYFADEFRRELGSNLIIGNGKIPDSKKGFQLVLALLNKEYINQETMVELFGDYTLDEFQNLTEIVKNIVSTTLNKSVKYSYDKYCINKTLGKYLSDIQNVFISKNHSEIEQVLEGYYLSEQNSVKQGDNFLVDYYMHLIFNVAVDFNKIKNQNVSNAYFDYLDNIDKFPDKITELYNSFHNKIKIIN